MIKKLFPAVKGYGKPAIGASLMIVAEGVLEILIPFFMTKLINNGIDIQEKRRKWQEYYNYKQKIKSGQKTA